MIIGLMIVKNEADRYLQASLTRLREVCNKVLVVDDRSEDDSVSIAKNLDCKVWIRDNKTPSFQDSESHFRQASWNKLSSIVKAKDSDFILVADADEFVLGSKEMYMELSKKAEHRKCFSVPIPEVWQIDPLQIRTDGFWNENINRRIAKYDQTKEYRNVPLGCGSVPYYKEPSTQLSPYMGILHFGYACEEDRRIRYDRYKNHPNNGHNPKHIDSIIQKPKLVSLESSVDFWRGVK